MSKAAEKKRREQQERDDRQRFRDDEEARAWAAFAAAAGSPMDVSAVEGVVWWADELLQAFRARRAR